MKKILGILGVSLVMAVSFFNMSSVTDVNQNVDLASLIQNASADSEGGGGYESMYTDTYTRVWKMNGCYVTQTTDSQSCSGDGDLQCVSYSIPSEIRIISCN